MYRFALLGRDIGYTRSPKIHSAIAEVLGIDITFEVADVTYDMLGQTVKNLLDRSDGFFVTKPYKIDVKRYLPPQENAERSVNVVRSRDVTAYNTDGVGLMYALDRNFRDWRGDVSSVLVLGAGGAAYSAVKALIGAGKRVYVLDRTLMNAVKLCSAYGAELYANQPAELAVNCTSVGSNGEDVLRSLCVLPSFKYAYDLVYTTESTPFMRRCVASGGVAANGADMLIYQAIVGDGLLLGEDLDVCGVYEKVIKTLNNAER